MAIVSSTIVEDSRQIDGRRWIRERHVDQLGLEHIVMYLCEAAFDVPTAMAARAIQISADLANAEIQVVLDGINP
jgi:hypothetical protein